MDLRKGETSRYRLHTSDSRYEITMYPEQLCDHDIMIWRDPEYSYNHRRTGETIDENMPTHIQMVRFNDTQDVKAIEHFFERVTQNFRSSI